MQGRVADRSRTLASQGYAGDADRSVSQAWVQVGSASQGLGIVEHQDRGRLLQPIVYAGFQVRAEFETDGPRDLAGQRISCRGRVAVGR